MGVFLGSEFTCDDGGTWVCQPSTCRSQKWVSHSEFTFFPNKKLTSTLHDQS